MYKMVFTLFFIHLEEIQLRKNGKAKKLYLIKYFFALFYRVKSEEKRKKEI